MARRSGIRGTLQEQDVGIGLRFMLTTILTSVYIVNYRYSSQREWQEDTPMTDTIHETVREHYAEAVRTALSGPSSTCGEACCTEAHRGGA